MVRRRVVWWGERKGRRAREGRGRDKMGRVVGGGRLKGDERRTSKLVKIRTLTGRKSGTR